MGCSVEYNISYVYHSVGLLPSLIASHYEPENPLAIHTETCSLVSYRLHYAGDAKVMVSILGKYSSSTIGTSSLLPLPFPSGIVAFSFQLTFMSLVRNCFF